MYAITARATPRTTVPTSPTPPVGPFTSLTPAVHTPGNLPKPSGQRPPVNLLYVLAPKHVFQQGLNRLTKRPYSTEASQDLPSECAVARMMPTWMPNGAAQNLPPIECAAVEMTTRIGPDGETCEVQRFGFHGTNIPPEIILNRGIRAPGGFDTFSLDTPEEVRKALAINASLLDENSSPLYGSQFVSMSKDIEIAAKRGNLKRELGEEDVYVYVPDNKKLLEHGYKVFDVNVDLGSSSTCPVEKEMNVPHCIPTEFIVGGWVGRWEGIGEEGRFVRKPFLNPNYGNPFAHMRKDAL